MATVAALAERVRLIGLSLIHAAKKGDTVQIANWAHQLAHVAADLATAAAPAAPLVVVVPASPAVLTADQVWAKFLDAEDAVLIARGQPAGREGAERGAVSRDEALAIVAGLGIPDALDILASGGYGFGPEPLKGTIA